MNDSRPRPILSLRHEFLIASLIGVASAFALKPEMMDRIDGMLVTFMSIVVAAAIPGIALTAASPRPLARSPLEATKFGTALSRQVSFWFGFLWTGGLAVALLIVGKAFGWKLMTIDRPKFLPTWTPPGGAWLVFVAITAVIFVAIRTRHIVSAVQSIISIGTEVQAQLAAERERATQAEVAADIARIKDDPRRGSITDRQRH